MHGSDCGLSLPETGSHSLGTPHPPDRGDGQGHQPDRVTLSMTVGLTRLGQSGPCTRGTSNRSETSFSFLRVHTPLTQGGGALFVFTPRAALQSAQRAHAITNEIWALACVAWSGAGGHSGGRGGSSRVTPFSLVPGPN